jgi:preprotein translocase subunit SecE
MADRNIVKGSLRFLHEVRAELARVVWPTWGSLAESTVVVLVLVMVFAIYLGVLDFGILNLVQYVIKGRG